MMTCCNQFFLKISHCSQSQPWIPITGRTGAHLCSLIPCTPPPSLLFLKQRHPPSAHSRVFTKHSHLHILGGCGMFMNHPAGLGFRVRVVKVHEPPCCQCTSSGFHEPPCCQCGHLSSNRPPSTLEKQPPPREFPLRLYPDPETAQPARARNTGI